VIDQREKRDAFGLQNSLQLLDCFVYRMITRDIDQSIGVRRLHRYPKSFSISSPLAIEIWRSRRSCRKALITCLIMKDDRISLKAYLLVVSATTITGAPSSSVALLPG
jgi:hypothetical protein